MSKLSRIIVIDNNDATRHSFERLIGSSGHTVSVYASGLRYLDDAVRDGRPDCVILNTDISEITALELFGILKTQYPDLPIIFFAGNPDRLLADEARALGPRRIFTNPLNTDAILNCIGEALAPSNAH
jgi:FixJ family two-component response regulator